MTVVFAAVAALTAVAALAHVLAYYGHKPPVAPAVEPAWPEWKQPADQHVHIYEEAA